MNIEETYSIIIEFIETVGISNREFARQAYLNPGSFQAMLSRKSGMKISTYEMICDAMGKIVYSPMENLSYDACKKAVDLYQQFRKPLVMEKSYEPLEVLQVIKNNTNFSRLHTAFDQLNEKGQQTAAERVEELTQIEAYRKDGD